MNSQPEPGDEIEVEVDREPAQVGQVAPGQEFAGVPRQNHVDEKLVGRAAIFAGVGTRRRGNFAQPLRLFAHRSTQKIIMAMKPMVGHFHTFMFILT